MNGLSNRLAPRTLLSSTLLAMAMSGVPTLATAPAFAEAVTLERAAAQAEATPRRLVRLRFGDAPDVILPKLLTRVDLYDPTIAEVRFDHTNSMTPGEMGVGSVRICVFEDGRELHEPILVYDPPRAYAYTVDADASTMALPVSAIALFYRFAPAPEGGTELTVRAHFDPAVPGTGPIIEPVLTGTLRRTFQTAVETFGGQYLGDEAL